MVYCSAIRSYRARHNSSGKKKAPQPFAMLSRKAGVPFVLVRLG
jgi:hypothetical protein